MQNNPRELIFCTTFIFGSFPELTGGWIDEEKEAQVSTHAQVPVSPDWKEGGYGPQKQNQQNNWEQTASRSNACGAL